MDNDKGQTGHPLDRQNQLEREIQLEGSKDPDNYRMPDGRTLTEVRQELQKIQDAEYQEELKMVASRTRELSISSFQKTGEKLVMTPTGSIVDVTEPVMPEKPALSISRTSMADIEAGAIKPLREHRDNTSDAPGNVSPSIESATDNLSPST